VNARDIEKQILNLIESSFEDTRVPDAIAAHADKRTGKLVTKTDAEQLEAQLGVPVRILRRYGMTQVAKTGIEIQAVTSPINAAIDAATGASTSTATRFIEWATREHWGIEHAPVAYQKALTAKEAQI
jgi:hypothetical protein